MSIFNSINFSHSGDTGDLIYGLCAIRGIGGGHLYLTVDPKAGVREPMTPEKSNSIKALLHTQPYIQSCSFGPSPDPKTINFDSFRSILYRYPTLAHAQLAVCKLFPSELNYPWLQVAPRSVAPILFARTPRYNNPNVYYPKITADAAFIGTTDEHRSFINRWHYIPHIITPTLLDLAQVIAGSQMLYCNQSTPLALAVALGANATIEQAPDDWNRNCYFPSCSNLKYTLA